jgi:NAD(P)-dependent dehydrogenase (short-subunit alcohol dehydrogenase family)
VCSWDPEQIPPATDMLVIDGAALFAQPLPGAAQGGKTTSAAARSALSACMEAAWELTQAVVNAAFLPAARAGRIVFLAPAPDAGTHADAARAALENLSRTLSIEWARYAITLVTIAPGVHTSRGELAALSAYLASPAGAYFSGCLLDLRGSSASRLAR